MAHNKRRVMQTIMEEKSLGLVRTQLPEEWVIHEYAPDYGIDFVVETFKYINPEHTIAETLGEFFFVQMKSTESVTIVKKEVTRKFNVEKTLREDTSDTVLLDVVSYPLDVNEIHTIMSIGTAVPVVLFLADLSSENIYFVCLTDYIEKIVLPQNLLETHTASINIYFPLENILSSQNVISHLAFLARRSKLMGAFNKFNYQRDELFYNDSEEMILRFISIVKSYDFWIAQPQWPVLEIIYDELLEVEEFYLSSHEQREKIINQDVFLKSCLELLDGDEDFPSITQKINSIYHKGRTSVLWQKLCNLGNLYEEFCKEWFLPTYFWVKGPFGKTMD